MRIFFLGTGTSTGIPQIGCNCSTCLSTDPKDKRLRASVIVEIDDNKILIDSGPDLRQQLLKHGVKNLSNVLLTHEHYDHVGGLDDIRPLGVVTVFAEKKVINTIRRNMSYCFSENKYPGVPLIHLREIKLEPFKIENITIQPVRIMHARLPILGFRIAKMAYLTDVKTIEESAIDQLQGLDILILNALRHKAHISHINLKEAVALAMKINARKTYFIHLSHDMGKHEITQTTLPENMFIAYDDLVLNL
ncbi:MAG: MBL fold metallo-hydrolase [Paludibacter sp.]|nr:MBL fold metallo-hydrolase [Paludibacter sp.]